jgi:redox-sensitive bicupin YhaK (pirin superfamily)
MQALNHCCSVRFVLQPLAGFGTHPHRDMELFTYIVEGEMAHRDSLGGIETLSPGSVQYLGAGTGILHSEMNNGTAP